MRERAKIVERRREDGESGERRKERGEGSDALIALRVEQCDRTIRTFLLACSTAVKEKERGEDGGSKQCEKKTV